MGLYRRCHPRGGQSAFASMCEYAATLATGCVICVTGASQPLAAYWQKTQESGAPAQIPGSEISALAQAKALAQSTSPGERGLIVFEPTAEGAIGRDDLAFGMGCGDWLELNVAGQPRLGSSPLYSDIDRAKRELKIDGDDLCVPVAKARAFAKVAAATDFVACTLRQAPNASGLTLTCRVYHTATGTLEGKPLSITGTKETIRLGLPKLAVAISSAVGITTVDLPVTVDGTVAQLRETGGLLWHKETSDGDREIMRRDEKNVAFVSLPSLQTAYVWERGIGRDSTAEFPKFLEVANGLLGKLPNNQLAWEIATRVSPASLDAYRNSVSARRATYPGSYGFARAALQVHVPTTKALAGREYEEAVLRTSPANSTAWVDLGVELLSEAESIRRGRFANNISREEWIRLRDLYQAAEFCDRRAVALDPVHEAGWLALADAGTFADDPATATAAFAKAEQYSPYKYALYDWGLEMFQGKWGGDPKQLAAVAKRASETAFDNSGEVRALMRKLVELGFPDLATSLAHRTLREWDAKIAKAPKSSIYHEAKAVVLEQMGDRAGALAEDKAATLIAPSNTQNHLEYATLLVTNRNFAESIPQLQFVIGKQPRNYIALYELGDSQIELGQYSEAEKSLNACLALAPDYTFATIALGNMYNRTHKFEAARVVFEKFNSSPRATIYGYIGLARALVGLNRPTDAINVGSQALQSLQRQPVSPVYRSRLEASLGTAYCQVKDYDKAEKYLDSAVRDDPENMMAHLNRGVLYQATGRVPDARKEWLLVTTSTTHKDDIPDAETLLKTLPASAP